MSAATERLTLATRRRVPAVHRSDLDPRALSIGVVHLGLGVFHRTHQVPAIEQAALATGETRWGVSAYSERTPAAADTLALQDGLYSLRIAAPDADSLQVLSSLREARFAPGDPVLLERIASPAVALVTLTVTEKGYRHDAATRRLRRDDPELLADAAGRPPLTVVGQLVRGLEVRAASDAPLTVMSCDNLADNGALLAGLVAEFCALPGARVAPGLRGYLERSVRFPSTVVDRISPAPGPAERAAAAAALGLVDEAAVVTEPATQWVIENRFAGARPALENAGVLLVESVRPYAELKLRVLNGAHSAIAWLGLLAGERTVADALGRPELAGFVERLLAEEICPSVPAPAGVSVPDYAASLWVRFANPALTYANAQVASDGAMKLAGRLLPSVRACLAAGVLPRRTALVIAAYLRLVATGRDERGAHVAWTDALAERLRPDAGAAATPGEVVAAALAQTSVFGEDLAGDERFRALLVEAYAALARGRLGEVLAE